MFRQRTDQRMAHPKYWGAGHHFYASLTMAPTKCGGPLGSIEPVEGDEGGGTRPLLTSHTLPALLIGERDNRIGSWIMDHHTSKLRQKLFRSTVRALTLLCILISSIYLQPAIARAAVTLDPADLIIIGYSAADPDSFAMLALADIPGGEVIFITDRGWNAQGNQFIPSSGSENTITWTVPGGVSAGTILYIASLPGTASGFVTLGGGGDQLLIYQTGDGNPNSFPAFVYGFNNNIGTNGPNTVGQWQDPSAPLNPPNDGSHPPLGTTEVTAPGGSGNAFGLVGEHFNVFYDVNKPGAITAGTKEQWIAAIHDPANWTLDNTPVSIDLAPGAGALPAPGSLRVGCTVYVKQGGAGNQDGSSWANAFAHLQDPLKTVNDCHIWVAQGIYYPDEGLNQINDAQQTTFWLRDGVAVYGGFVGTENSLSERDWENNVTVLSGDIEQNDTPAMMDPNSVLQDTNGIVGANAYHVVKSGGTDDTAVLDGFFITAGYANDIEEQCTTGPSCGGGLLNVSGSPTLANLAFHANRAAKDGGGMHNHLGSPTLTNMHFQGNSAGFGTCGGGGLCNFGGGIHLTGAAFQGNSALSGGGFANIGISGKTVALINIIFEDNSATSFGGGMRSFSSGANVSLINVSFIGNDAQNGGGMANQGALSLTNVLFNANSATGSGGGVVINGSSPTLTNVTFHANFAPTGGGVVNNNGSPVLVNAILWGNQDSNGLSASAQIITPSGTNFPQISHSLIQDSGGSGGGWDTAVGTDGGNNIDADPLFVQNGDASTVPPTAGDLHLQSGSPAVNAGLNSAVPNTVSTDLDGNPRIQDTTVDMGAYERPEPPRAVDDVYLNGEIKSNILLDVLQNDTPNGLTILNVSQPMSGSAAIDSNQISYTPPQDFAGVETFTYTVGTGNESDTALVFVLVDTREDVDTPNADVASISNDNGGQLAAPGLTVVVDAGDVSADLTLLYQEVSPAVVGGPPADFQLGNLGFSLDAFVDGAAQEEFNFDNSVTFTLSYSDEDVAGIEESTLELRFWDEGSSSWLGGAANGIDCQPVDVVNNALVCEVSHLTPFGVMGASSGDAVLGGLVWNDIDDNNAQNGMEPWLAGAELFVRRAGDDGTLNTADDVILPDATVDATGRYTVENLPADDYLLTFDVLSVPVGLEPISGNDRMTVTLGASEVRSDLDIPLTYIGKAAVGNYVWEDENGNGDFSDTGEGEFDGGIDGVTMTLWLEMNDDGVLDPADDLLLDITMTDDDLSTAGTTESGWYSFDVAAETGLSFWVAVDDANFNAGEALDGYTQTNGSDNRSLLAALATAGDDTVDFGYAQTGSIGDFVWYDTDGNGEQETGEPGIPSVVVSLTLSSGVVITEETDANGLYSFDNRLPDDYTVTVGDGVPANAVNTIGSDSQSSPYALTISSGQDVDDADFGYDVPTSYVITHTNDVINEARAGEDMVFTVVITNTGGSWITALPVRYYYDERIMRFESSTPAPDVAADDGELDWSDLLSVSNPLAPGDSIEIVLTFKALRDPGTQNDNTTTNTVEILDGGLADPDGPQIFTAAAATVAMATSGPLGSIEPVDGNEGSGVGSDVMILASTGVEMAESSVTQTEAGTLIRWSTISELRVRGFNVLRESNGQMAQVNAEMIVAQSSSQAAGGSYEIVDTAAADGVTYWLDVVGIDGSADRIQIGAQTSTDIDVFLPLITR